ncbi:hypothetical protein RJ639_045652 [Escallonia herrerae]|uniref:Uncharacterized protein n=1 Tax=Escallonia herrerae TaxID=1293975 RepID=A0AA88W6S4_9ASTE|nr:hypothetical protein RJ639_045652 [Escallonia herrerae]
MRIFRVGDLVLRKLEVSDPKAAVGKLSPNWEGPYKISKTSLGATNISMTFAYPGIQVGYMSPEYAVDGLFSVSSDVFSFGVLVLEIVSGKKNRCFIHPDHHHNLLGHAWRLHKEDTSMELIDPHIRDSCLASEVLRSIHVGLLCVQQCPKERPSMSSVVLMLASDSTLPQPKHPGFFTERNIESQSSPGMLAPGSVNQVSLTQLSAR